MLDTSRATMILGTPVRYLVLRRCQTFSQGWSDGSTFTQDLQGVAPDPDGSPPFYALFAGQEDGDNVLLCDFPADTPRHVCASIGAQLASVLVPNAFHVED